MKFTSRSFLAGLHLHGIHCPILSLRPSHNSLSGLGLETWMGRRAAATTELVGIMITHVAVSMAQFLCCKAHTTEADSAAGILRLFDAADGKRRESWLCGSCWALRPRAPVAVMARSVHPLLRPARTACSLRWPMQSAPAKFKSVQTFSLEHLCLVTFRVFHLPTDAGTHRRPQKF